MSYCAVILIQLPFSNNPYFNLAAEDFLLRNLDTTSNGYVLFYENASSVVVGKNQSIYREVNFECLRDDKVLKARRISGGGTVYHGRGNLSFAFIEKHEDFKVNNYNYFNERIVNALCATGLDVTTDERNNILCNGKKISGNAQFTNRKSIISHGTLLLNADLGLLRWSLKTNPFTIETKAVSSVPSSVTNLAEHTNRFLNTSDLIDYLIKDFAVTDIYRLSSFEEEQVTLLAKKMSEHNWVYGRSPETKIMRDEIELVIKEGVLVSATNLPAEVMQAVVNLPYAYSSIKKALVTLPNASYWLNRLY